MDDNLELMKQIKEAEKVNSIQPIPSTDLKLSFETHSEAIYTSRLLNFGDLPYPMIIMTIISTQFSVIQLRNVIMVELPL
ncbi:uncharacterized protein OCT59_012277 [Rhizophagus irregularis]|uniref:uncharacterized protein n=1 Tax=Rhizophagus irregularis TaxID=588596 RepID=UPI003325E28C|nr:hypothetical protein OCT59_012277 [Rhizophagus irregularis]